MLVMSWLLLATLDPAAPRGLEAGIDGTLRRRELDGATVAVAVRDADTGEWIYARQVDAPLAPASNMKVLTTAAALSVLEPEAVFVTRVLAHARPGPDGVLLGDLVVVGGGDPCLRADVLAEQGIADPAAALAELLREAGLGELRGRLVLDEGLFDAEQVHPDWSANDLGKPFAAPVAALSIHGNCLTVAVEGGGGGRPQATLVTRAAGYTLANELAWSAEAHEVTVGVDPPDAAGRVRVWGKVGRRAARTEVQCAVRDAVDLFARCLQQHLAVAGPVVRIPGAASQEAGTAGGGEPAASGLVELARWETPLDLALVLANKESDNSIADHLFKRTGAEVFGQGSFASGAAALSGFLARVVETPTDGLVLRDGSGLSAQNRVTARAVVDTLVAMNQGEPASRDLFLRTLPVSGFDGTLDARLQESPFRGAVRAKTGFIRGVSALSGYARTAAGRTLAFSILINGIPAGRTNGEMKAIQDDICRALVEQG